MKVAELIAELSKYPSDAEVVNLEVEDWQFKICNNEWRLRIEYFDGAKMIMLNPE